MSVIKYIALEDLIAGHTASVEYAMEVPVKRLDPVYETDKTPHTSIGGNSQTVFRSETQFWSLTMGSFPRTSGEGSMEQVREFIASVRGGEIFTFDAYGSIASPDNEQDVIWNGSRFSRGRLGSLERFDVPLEFRVVG